MQLTLFEGKSIVSSEKGLVLKNANSVLVVTFICVGFHVCVFWAFGDASIAQPSRAAAL